MSISPNPSNREHSVKCELAGEILRSSGTLRLKVTGWSMLPSVLPGDTLVVKPAKGDSVSRGDIVLFGRNRRLFAHRVVERVQSSQILTRGDSMARNKIAGPRAALHTMVSAANSGRSEDASRYLPA